MRAKTKPGQDAGRAKGSALRATEDAARRRVCSRKQEAGPTDRTRGSADLCKQKNRAISEFTGQNGKLYNTKPVLQAKCGKAKKKGKRHR